jgi:hypothetical protein
MDRRLFLRSVTGGLLLAPLAVEAQAPTRAARIGVLASAECTAPVQGAIRDGLADRRSMTSRTLGVAIPPSPRQRADRVIE